MITEPITTTADEGGQKPVPENIPVPATTGSRFAKTDDPKSFQFTGRATKKEAERLTEALAARKQQKGLTDADKFDIVRLALDLIDHVESQWLNDFRTKKK